MAIFGRCKFCPVGTRETLLIGDVCKYHQEHGGSLAEIPAGLNTDVITVPKIEKAIHSATAKQAALNRQYFKLRTPFLEANPFCLARIEGCTGRSNDVHHKKGRGKYLLVMETWLPVCRSCHDYIGANDEEAILRGLSVKRHTEE